MILIDWISDGDTTRYPINNLDGARTFSKKEIKKLLSTKEYMAKERHALSSDPEKWVDKLFLYGHGQWNYLLTDSYDGPEARESKLEITYAGVHP